jgi:hypothetical protein
LWCVAKEWHQDPIFGSLNINLDGINSINSFILNQSKKRLLFDFLVGTCEHRWRSYETECLGRFEINHQPEFTVLGAARATGQPQGNTN